MKTLRPRDYNEVLFVGQYFRKGIPVVMDLTSLADDEARQLIDFAAGLICARGGDMERLSPKLFLLKPAVLAGPRTMATLVKELRPHGYNDALHVGHYFREGMTVVMDLTAMGDDEARQLIDFAAGLICARGGDMDRLGPKLFQLVPSAVGTAGTANTASRTAATVGTSDGAATSEEAETTPTPG